jgi:hypothetical protein
MTILVTSKGKGYGASIQLYSKPSNHFEYK